MHLFVWMCPPGRLSIPCHCISGNRNANKINQFYMYRVTKVIKYFSPPLTLICIPRMPTRSGSQPGTLGRCRQGRLPAQQKQQCRAGCMTSVGWAARKAVCLAWIGVTVWRETELTRTVTDGLLWPHIATSRPAGPNRLSAFVWLFISFSIEMSALVLHKRLYWEWQVPKSLLYVIAYRAQSWNIHRLINANIAGKDWEDKDWPLTNWKKT